MAILIQRALVFCLILSSCGDALVDETYLGEPLVRVEGQLRSFEPGRATGNPFYVSIFWNTLGNTSIDVPNLLEQTAVGVKVEFPNSFVLNVFEAPVADGRVKSTQDSNAYWLGLLLIYEDVNKNGRFESTELRGGAEDTVLIYTEKALSPSVSPTGRALTAGYQVVRLPISCTCAVPVGERCAADGDCGRDGVCLGTIPGQNFPGGYCSIRLDEGTCLPDGSKGMFTYINSANGSVSQPETNAYKRCTADEQCRLDEAYLCCGGVCAPNDGFTDCPVYETCNVPIGSSCSKDQDCGFQGKCLTKLGYDLYANGYCTLSAESQCIPSGAMPIYRVTAAADLGSGYYHLECNSDSDCRTAEGYACSSLDNVCAPIQPVYLTVDPVFSPAPFCRQAY